MIFLPANRAWSINVLLRPDLRLDAVPAWTLNILRFQIGVVFVFAGLAKLNADWLLSAQPLRIWLAARSDLPLLGPLLDNAGIAYVASWFGAFATLNGRPSQRLIDSNVDLAGPVSAGRILALKY